MNDDRLRAAYTRATALRGMAPRPECPSPEQLLALVERHGAEADRLATAAHVARCADCRRDLDLLRAIHSTRPPMARWIVSMVAAAAILVVAGLPIARHYADRRSPSEATRAADEITLITPRGDSPDLRPLVLRWRAVPLAARYDVSVVGDDGSTPVRLTTTDTTLTIGVETRLDRGREYYWTVSARLSDGGEKRADPVKFRLVAP